MSSNGHLKTNDDENDTFIKPDSTLLKTCFITYGKPIISLRVACTIETTMDRHRKLRKTNTYVVDQPLNWAEALTGLITIRYAGNTSDFPVIYLPAISFEKILPDHACACQLYRVIKKQINASVRKY